MPEFDFKTLRNGGPLELCWKGNDMRIIKTLLYVVYDFFIPSAFDGDGREDES